MREDEDKLREWVMMVWLLGPGVFTLSQWMTLGRFERDTILSEAKSLGKR